MDPSLDEYDYALGILKHGDEAQLGELAQMLVGFPHGVDSFLGRRWIINAIDSGSIRSIRWMLQAKVDIRFQDEEGRTVLHAAIDRHSADRLECLELLLKSRAQVNAYGVNGWTPAHLAAARDDVESLQLLKKYGANLRIRGSIDMNETPLQEAIRFKSARAVAFLKRNAA
jgi:ankyrin repeat protein